MSEQDLRTKLAEAGIHLKLRTKRLRKDLLKRAEVALGLRAPSADEDEARTANSIPSTDPMASPETTVSSKRSKARRTQDKAERWPLIGRREEISYLDATEIEGIHFLLVEDFRRGRDPIEPAGVRDDTLLGSASFRPHTSIAGELKYPSVAMAGAALFHALGFPAELRGR